MGCLPLPLFLLLGFGIGYLVDGRSGSVWGGGIGLLVGLLLTGWLLRKMRRANRQ
ncbi:hypothetical protein EC912_106104 [Luteibacter rhizovicinus]|uniref:Uncharacterized protein n=1 Tax=Luteibacter rhizovicinus TaxID=242606 RepID=A0A4R3YKH3_9GAMM|nr:hypothetical protein [Luteibacter rhizovicinus]TCV92766.1 hypothetical protein EC912_106104 [Luteibacter rhizovicinus]